MNFPDHKMKIVCTIGPASESQEIMERMLRAGMTDAHNRMEIIDLRERQGR